MRKLRFLIFNIAAALIISGCGMIRDTAVAEGGGFAVHFIDVGQADAALVICDGAAMLIDGGNAEDSSLIAAYLKKQNVSRLDYMIATHAHEDHIGGLAGALSTVEVGKVFAPETGADTKVYKNFIDKVHSQGLEPECPEVGDTVFLGSSTVMFLGPVSEEGADTNDTSVMCRVKYGDTSFLFTGDASRAEEQSVLETGYDLSADVLKVGHHGSAESTTYPFLREVMPKYAVISVGKDNDYGHPTDEALSRLADAGAKIYRTDMQGDIIAESDGKTISISAAKNQNAVTAPTKEPQQEEAEYIGNIRGKKFHKSTCSSLPEEKNRVYFSSRTKAVSDGYSPCGKCKP